MQIFSKEELRDIIISVLAISFIFTFPNFSLFPFYLLIVILAFVCHEIAHKFLAIKFKCAAFYKMWLEGIIFGLVFMIIGFKFVAPGAVVIYPYQFGRWGFRVVHLTMTEMGLIAFAGISVNLFFAIAFKPLAGMLIIQGMDVFGSLVWVNTLLTLFNLLPIPPLDGSKIFRWQPLFWFFLFIVAILLVFLNLPLK